MINSMATHLQDKMLENIGDLTLMVMEENVRQVKKWGVQNHSAFIWMAALSEEVGELAEAMLKHELGGEPSQACVDEAIQVATLALKVAEMYKFNKEEPHGKGIQNKENH